MKRILPLLLLPCLLLAADTVDPLEALKKAKADKDWDAVVRIGLEIFKDDKVAADQRADAALQAAWTLCQTQKDTARAGEILAEAYALPTSPKKRGEVRNRQVMHAVHHQRPQDEAAVRALTFGAVTNSDLLPGDRLNQAFTCLDFYRKMAKPADKLFPVAPARAFVREAGTALAPRDAARVENEILKNLSAAGAAARDDALATAKALYANTNAIAFCRSHGASVMAARLREEGDELGANALLESCYEFKDNRVNEIEDIAKAIGRSFILRDQCDAAIEAYKAALRFNDTPDMRKRVDALILAAYKTFYRFEEARAFALSRGWRMEAARLSSGSMDDYATAGKLYREILSDASAPLADRLAAWRWLFVRDPALADRSLVSLLGATDAATNETAKALVNMISERGGGSYSFTGNYGAVRRAYAHLERIHAATGRTWPFAAMQYAANAFYEAKDAEAAAKICRDALEWKVTEDPAELYQLNMMATLFPLQGDEAALEKAVRAADAKFAGDLAPKTRLGRLDRVGSAVVTGANEPLARALAAFRKSLFVPSTKKEYVVRYSAEPITGLAAWEKLQPKPEAQPMDRQYGGSMDFLATDVATGNRGEGIGTEKAKKDAGVPTLEVVCDAFGIHFRFEAPDEKAAEMAAGFLGGGSYEAYLAPGENQPYYCLLMDVAPNATLHLFNTTYNTTGHRRIRNEDAGLYKSETAFTDHSAVSYIMLSWNAFATLIPSKGTVWEFENVHWGRADKAAWNGTESIHGRSTWGRLVFDLPEKARIEILKRVIFAVRKSYLAAKGAGGMGAVDRWRDPTLGDPAFYAECVAPLVEKLDAYLPLVKVDMADDDVLKVAEEALPGWRDIAFTVARLRADYLAKEIAEGR